MEVRIRLGNGIARLAPAPMFVLELPDGATVEDLYDLLGNRHPDLGPALRSALPVVRGAHVGLEQALSNGDEVALLVPVSGG